MNLEKIYLEEDLFPREITLCEERSYGFLFFNLENKDSYDSNHAIVYREKISDLDEVLEDIIGFYMEKGIRPIIYQSISEECYFEEIGEKLTAHGFESWTEEQRYMVFSEKMKLNQIQKLLCRKYQNGMMSMLLRYLKKQENHGKLMS